MKNLAKNVFFNYTGTLVEGYQGSLWGYLIKPHVGKQCLITLGEIKKPNTCLLGQGTLISSDCLNIIFYEQDQVIVLLVSMSFSLHKCNGIDDV